VDRATVELMRTWDLSVAQFDVLNKLGTHEGITQQELADRLLVTKGNISQLIVRMERRGLIRRCQEGRAMRLSLTDEGRRLREAAVPAQEALVARHFAALSPEETRALHTLLRRVDRGG
jgi:DNA-binding MarR family transcriptional regulator